MASLWALRLEVSIICISAFVAFLYLTTPHHLFFEPHSESIDHGAVASESRICTQVGVNLLKAGGNAADAAVGTTFCIGVVGMYHSGIGGGGMALVRSSNATYRAIDFRETAPAAAHVDMFKNNVEASLHGGLASGVPGQLRGLEYIHKHYGKLPWSDLVRPSVDIARTGFVISRDLIRAMGIPATHDRRRTPKAVMDNSFLTEDPAWAADFAPNGTRLGLGDVMTRQRYADTLEEIASSGVDSFYTGKFASQIVRTVQEANGSMTADDLARYSVVARKPVEIFFHGYRVLACGEPASGAVTLSILKTIEGYQGFAHPKNNNLSTHRLLEAMRFGYGKRASFGDPDFLEDYGSSSRESSILKPSYAASIRERIIDEHTQNVSAYDPSGFEILDDRGTSQISVIDASGMAVSFTTTINLYFGSHVMVPESGIILNDEMNDFSIPGTSNVFGYKASPANYIRPRKRPLSSLSPAIAESIQPASSTRPAITVLGSAGGSRIITAVVQTALFTLLYNFTAYASVANARLHDQLLPNVATFELAFDNATIAAMQEKGHNIAWVPPGYSSAHIVRLLENGTFEAAAETRQNGSAGIVG
ncbi:MAG: hypothetical protein Q9182_001489 [Xanthomendoza sp. 2 TL-2023]